MSQIKGDNNGKNPTYNSCRLDTTKCIRKVSKLERMFIWSPYANVSMITRINGNVSKEQLIIAIDAVQHMHPFIGVKVVFDENYNAWFSNDKVPSPNLKTVDRVSGTQWFKELQYEIKIPFDQFTGPMIRFILVHSDDVSDLIIICNHSICDGMSLVCLVRDLLTHYLNPKKITESLSPPDIIDLLPKKHFSLSSTLLKLFVHNANRQWKKHPYYFDNEDFKAIQTEYWENNMFGTVLLELDPDETKTLSKNCKNNNITIGSALTTAFIAAHEDIVGPFDNNHKPVSIPFDMRRHSTTPIGNVFCLCVGSSRFSFTYDARKSFWENSLILQEEIHDRVKNLNSNGFEIPDLNPALMDGISFALLNKVVPNAYTQTENLSKFSKDKNNVAYSFANKMEQAAYGTISSNLGRPNIPETYKNLKIDRMAFLTPGGTSFDHLIIGGISIGDRLVFSMNYIEPNENFNSMTKKMIQIRNNALEYLGFPDKTNEKIIT